MSRRWGRFLPFGGARAVQTSQMYFLCWLAQREMKTSAVALFPPKSTRKFLSKLQISKASNLHFYGQKMKRSFLHLIKIWNARRINNPIYCRQHFTNALLIATLTTTMLDRDKKQRPASREWIINPIGNWILMTLKFPINSSVNYPPTHRTKSNRFFSIQLMQAERTIKRESDDGERVIIFRTLNPWQHKFVQASLRVKTLAKHRIYARRLKWES